MMKSWWWGCRYLNGALVLKPYIHRLQIKEAESSSIVDEVFQPFEADTRDEASLILHQKANP